eukprot:NODE_12_length_54577_cov_0.384100.p6 type:complete len:584 gc:universal NODE_12_length_54577_cov_0.384100:7233-8984(+)
MIFMILLGFCVEINSTVSQLFKYSKWLQSSIQFRMEEEQGLTEYLEDKYKELTALHSTVDHAIFLVVNATGFKGLNQNIPLEDVDSIIRSASVIRSFLDKKVGSQNPQLGDLMDEIKKTADSIDDKIQTDDFKKKLNDGHELLTLVKNDNILIDKDDNEYTVRKFSDFTYFEDIDLLNDIIVLFVLATGIGILFSVLKLPIFLGHLLAGALLGPYGYNMINCMVQVETLGQLGVLLILFALGMEFSFEKIQKIWKISLNTSMGLILACALGVILFKSLLQLTILESFLIGLNISLSSTIVVLKFMSEGEMEECGKITIGILISQDIILSILLSILPIFAESSFFMLLFSCIKLFVLITVFYVACYILRRPVLLLFNFVQHRQDVKLLSIVGYAFVMARLGLILNLSSELGCFVAGFLLSFDKKLSHDLFKVIDPIRDFTSCLFFASIGLQLNFQFLYKELLIVTLFSVGAIVIKFFYIFLNNIFLHDVHQRDALVIAIRLAQISEFSYMLMAKTKTLNLLSREIYHLIVGVTTMTLILNIAISMFFNKYVLKQDIYQYKLTTVRVKEHNRRARVTIYDQNFDY